METVTANAEAQSRLPDVFPEGKRARASDLIATRIAIEKSIEGKDEALVGPQKKQIEEINNELKSIADGTGDQRNKGTDSSGDTTADNGESRAKSQVDSGTGGTENPAGSDTGKDINADESGTEGSAEPGHQALVEIAKKTERPNTPLGRGVYDSLVSGDPEQVSQAIETVKSMVEDSKDVAINAIGKEIVDAVMSKIAPSQVAKQETKTQEKLKIKN